MSLKNTSVENILSTVSILGSGFICGFLYLSRLPYAAKRLNRTGPFSSLLYVMPARNLYFLKARDTSSHGVSPSRFMHIFMQASNYIIFAPLFFCDKYIWKGFKRDSVMRKYDFRAFEICLPLKCFSFRIKYVKN